MNSGSGLSKAMCRTLLTRAQRLPKTRASWASSCVLGLAVFWKAICLSASASRTTSKTEESARWWVCLSWIAMNAALVLYLWILCNRMHLRKPKPRRSCSWRMWFSWWASRAMSLHRTTLNSNSSVRFTATSASSSRRWRWRTSTSRCSSTSRRICRSTAWQSLRLTSRRNALAELFIASAWILNSLSIRRLRCLTRVSLCLRSWETARCSARLLRVMPITCRAWTILKNAIWNCVSCL